MSNDKNQPKPPYTGVLMPAPLRLLPFEELPAAIQQKIKDAA